MKKIRNDFERALESIGAWITNHASNETSFRVSFDIILDEKRAEVMEKRYATTLESLGVKAMLDQDPMDKEKWRLYCNFQGRYFVGTEVERAGDDWTPGLIAALYANIRQYIDWVDAQSVAAHNARRAVGKLLPKPARLKLFAVHQTQVFTWYVDAFDEEDAFRRVYEGDDRPPADEVAAESPEAYPR